MNQKSIFFENASGYKLAAKLEMPEEVVLGFHFLHIALLVTRIS